MRKYYVNIMYQIGPVMFPYKIYLEITVTHINYLHKWNSIDFTTNFNLPKC